MDALKKEEIYTIDDVYSLPEGRHAELIDGRIYYMTQPSSTHQRISLSLSRNCDFSKVDEEGCHCAPDWIIEIVSPGNKPMDYFAKLFKYRESGAMGYWIVDPTKELVMVYRFERETMDQYLCKEFQL